MGEKTLPEKPPVYRQAFAIAVVGSLLLFAAQPPLAWSLLGWVAPLPWLYLATTPALPGRRPYLQIWLAGFLYWMLAIHWLRLAHPATFLGLLLLAGYFGVYLPLFVKLVRVGVRQLGIAVWLIAPVVWVAIEWLQAHLLGGFLMAALGHTQIEQLRLVQIADLGGAYLLSALVMLVAACLWEMAATFALRTGELPKWRGAAALLVAMAAIGGSLWYGEQQLEQHTPSGDAPTKHIALVQGSQKAVWTSDPGRDKRVMDVYVGLSQQARQLAEQKGRPLDLVVWPEGMFRTLLYSFDPERATTAELELAREYASYAPNDLARTVDDLDAPLLAGIDRYHVAAPVKDGIGDLYNSAVAVDATGEIVGTYDKSHLVMFGEYVPFGTIWPGIYQFFPIGGVTAGAAPASFVIDGVRYMPTICYETVIPHVIRRQVVELAAAGERPDVLVNITNDSWFDDSSELAMHLTCSRLRAIECRTPLVVAANGGLSANVDRCGRVLDVSEPMVEQVLLVDVVPGSGDSLYLRLGDVSAVGSLIAAVVLAIIGLLRKPS